MEHDWKGLCADDAARIILLAALAEDARKIHIVRDSEGATIYFISPDEMKVFDRLPVGTDELVCNYFTQLAGIETWGREAGSGYGLFVLGGMDINITVNIMRSVFGFDVILIPEIFQ